MRRRTARLVVVGATSLAFVGLTVGALTGPSGGATTTSSATTSSGVTTSTCLPVVFVQPSIPPGPPPVVTLAGPGTVAVGNANDGTEYDVPIGTVFNVRLVGLMVGSCETTSWSAPTASSAGVLQSPGGSDETSGSVATGTFDVVGAGTATISSQVKVCEPGCQTFSWSVSVHVAALPTPTSVLPRTE